MIFDAGGNLGIDEISRIFGRGRKRTHLTYSIDTEYFWGRAGCFRILTLLCGTVAFVCGLPGFVASQPDDIGYGDTYVIYAAIAFNGLAILLSIIWILLLLLFREVRYEEFWDETNMRFHVFGCVLCLVAGFSEIFGMYIVRTTNCIDCEKMRTQYSRRADTLAHSYRPEYWEYHNASFMLKLTTSMIFSLCSRMYLKNED